MANKTIIVTNQRYGSITLDTLDGLIMIPGKTTADNIRVTEDQLDIISTLQDITIEDDVEYTDTIVSWPAPASDNTVYCVDFTKPAVPAEQYMMIISNPSLVSNLGVDLYSLEPYFGSPGEIRQAKIEEFVVGKSSGEDICDCELVWTSAQGVDVAVNLDGVNKMEGTNSILISLTENAESGLLAYYDLPGEMNLSSYTHLKFWIKASKNISPGQLKILLSPVAGCSSDFNVEYDIPALEENAGVYLTIPVNYHSTLKSTASIGLVASTEELGACDINIDDIKAIYLNTEAKIYNGLFSGSNMRITLRNLNTLDAGDGFEAIVRLRKLMA